MTAGAKTMETAMQAFTILFVTCVVAIALSTLVGSHVLGHDESVYATKARSWIENTPADQFEIYRPIAMPVAGWVALQFSDSEKAIRAFGIIFGAALPPVVFLLFRRMFNFPVAITIVAIVSASPLFLRQAPLFLNDIPSTVLLVLITLLIYIQYESGGRSRSVYAIAPLAAAAFYIRYAAVTPLAVIALATHLLLFPEFIKNVDATFKRIGWSLLATIALFVPHFIYSLLSTGSLFGILSRAGKAANRAYVGDGLLQYIRWLPDELGGYALGVSAIVGTLFVLVLWTNSRMRHEFRPHAWLGTIGLGTFLITGLLTHAEPRYVLFPMILLSGVGVAGTYMLLATRSKTVAGAAMLAALLAVSVQGVIDYGALYAFYRSEETARHNTEFLRALAVIREDSGTDDCMIWTALSRPRVSWYTRCSVSGLGADPVLFQEEYARNSGKANYSIVYTLTRNPQVSLDTAGEFGLMLTEIFRADGLPNGDLIVYRVSPASGFGTSTASATSSVQ